MGAKRVDAAVAVAARISAFTRVFDALRTDADWAANEARINMLNAGMPGALQGDLLPPRMPRPPVPAPQAPDPDRAAPLFMRSASMPAAPSRWPDDVPVPGATKPLVRRPEDEISADAQRTWMDAIVRSQQADEPDWNTLTAPYRPVPRDLTGLPPKRPLEPYPWYTDPIPYELPFQRAIGGAILDVTAGPFVDAHRALTGQMDEEQQKNFAFEQALSLLAPPAKLAKIAIPIGMSAVRLFPRHLVQAAEAMEAAGRDWRYIVRETGLYRGAEGKWRFEVPDKGYRVRPYNGALDEDGFRNATLFEHHDHPALREAYPFLADIKSRLRIDRFRKPEAKFDPSANTLTITAPSPARAREMGVHELVHTIQAYEKHAPGGSYRVLLQQNPHMSVQEARSLVFRLAGEAEARAAEDRLRMTNWWRRRTPFRHMEEHHKKLIDGELVQRGVPRPEQILKLE